MPEENKIPQDFWENLFKDHRSSMYAAIAGILRENKSYANNLKCSLEYLDRIRKQQDELIKNESQEFRKGRHAISAEAKNARDNDLKRLERERRGLWEIENLLAGMMRESGKYEAELKARQKKFNQQPI